MYGNIKLEIILGRVQNIMGKGENAVYQHFSPFRTMYSKVFFTRVIKGRDGMAMSLRLKSSQKTIQVSACI